MKHENDSEKIKKVRFTNFVVRRRIFLKTNKDESFVVQEGKIPFMISAPHGVSQVRLGNPKVAEPGSLSLALELCKRTGAHLIAKTQNCNDDANFEETCPYKDVLSKYIKKHNIKFLIDIHGLKKTRDIDINIGTYLGENIKQNEKAFDFLNNKLESKGFVVSIDQPFFASPNSVATYISKHCGIWTIQLEVNYKFTNESQNVDRLTDLVGCLVEFVEKAEKFDFD